MGVTKLGERGQIVIPKDIRDEIGLKPGDFLEVNYKDGNIIIKVKKLVDMEDTLTEQEEKLVAEGFEQLKNGDFTSWDQLKNDLGL